MNLFIAIHSYHISARQVTIRYKANDDISYRQKNHRYTNVDKNIKFLGIW